MALPQGLNLQMMANRWATFLDPLLKNPISNGIILKDVPLILGATVIDHRLGRVPQGWILIDINAAATIYRSAAFNDLTLTLTSNAAVTASLYVF